MKKIILLLCIAVKVTVAQTYPNVNLINVNGNNIGENNSSGVEPRVGYKTDTYFLENATKGWYNGCLATYTLNFNQKYYYTEICAKQSTYDFQSMFTSTLAVYSLGGTYMPTIIECDNNFNPIGTVANSNTNPIFNGRVLKPSMFPNSPFQSKRYYKIFVASSRYKLFEDCDFYTMVNNAPSGMTIPYPSVYSTSNGKSYYVDESQSPFNTTKNPLNGQFTFFYQIRIAVDFNWGSIGSSFINMCQNKGLVDLSTMYNSTGYSGTYKNLSNIDYPDPINTNSLVPGNYIVNYVSTNGGCVTNSTFNILAKPTVSVAPVIGSFCLDSNTVNGSTFNLTGGTPTGGSYYLLGGINSNSLAAGTYPTYLWAGPGVKKIKYQYTASNGCIDSAKTNINIIQGTTINSHSWRRTLIQGAGTKFDSIAGVSDSYAWNFGDGLTASIKAPYHYYHNTGYFPVDITLNNTNGCNAHFIFDSLVNVLPFVGIEELSNNDVVEVNPTLIDKELVVKNKNINIIQVDIINAIGENIMTFSVFPGESNIINLENNAPGMYYVILQNQEVNYVKLKKVIKK